MNDRVKSISSGAQIPQNDPTILMIPHEFLHRNLLESYVFGLFFSSNLLKLGRIVLHIPLGKIVGCGKREVAG
jgi:hypothetical protein